MNNLLVLDVFRVTDPRVLECWNGWVGDDRAGMFVLPSPIDGGSLRVVATNAEGWDHVSVSRANRCPNWPEMAYIKVLFFKPDETAMELHVPVRDHINNQPHCLHLWRPHPPLAIPLPPSILVGDASEGTLSGPEHAREAHARMLGKVGL